MDGGFLFSGELTEAGFIFERGTAIKIGQSRSGRPAIGQMPENVNNDVVL
jgi:hypothetical protein